VALKIDSVIIRAKKRIWLLISIITNIGMLAFFKYGAFIYEGLLIVSKNFDLSLQETNYYMTFVLPAGISFYTFQSLSYSIDVYREKVKPTKDMLGFFNYVAYLPQLIAGPIERFNHLYPQIYQYTHKIPKSYWTQGLDRLALGVFQKLFIADGCGRIVDFLSNHTSNFDFILAWTFAIAFALQIYYDFSSYVNMALGISVIFGIKLSENFLSPYKSVSIQDFWRRWHITLSQWLRDYLYYPLGGSKYGNIRTFFNVLVTFTLCGLWHGAGLNFLVWGGLHALYLILFRIYKIIIPNFQFPVFIAVFITFIMVTFAWIPFRLNDIYSVVVVWSAMIGNNGLAPNLLSIFDIGFILLVLLATFSLPNCSERWPGSYGIIESASLWFLAVFAIFNSPHTNQFIYFQF